jgi:hypothetical protein
MDFNGAFVRRCTTGLPCWTGQAVQKRRSLFLADCHRWTTIMWFQLLDNRSSPGSTIAPRQGEAMDMSEFWGGGYVATAIAIVLGVCLKSAVSLGAVPADDRYSFQTLRTVCAAPPQPGLGPTLLCTIDILRLDRETGEVRLCRAQATDTWLNNGAITCRISELAPAHLPADAVIQQPRSRTFFLPQSGKSNEFQWLINEPVVYVSASGGEIAVCAVTVQPRCTAGMIFP